MTTIWRHAAATPVTHSNSGGSHGGWEFWLGLTFIVLVLVIVGVRQMSRRNGKG